MLKVAFKKAGKAGWTDKIVAWRTGCPYSHCGFIFSNGDFYDASPKRKGVHFTKWEDILVQTPIDQWDIVEVLGVTAYLERKLRKACELLVGAQYDWSVVWGIGLAVSVNVPKWYFCSELLVDRFKTIKMFTDEVASSVDPGKLWKLLIGWNEALMKYRYTKEVTEEEDAISNPTS